MQGESYSHEQRLKSVQERLQQISNVLQLCDSKKDCRGREQLKDESFMSSLSLSSVPKRSRSTQPKKIQSFFMRKSTVDECQNSQIISGTHSNILDFKSVGAVSKVKFNVCNGMRVWEQDGVKWRATPIKGEKAVRYTPLLDKLAALQIKEGTDEQGVKSKFTSLLTTQQLYPNLADFGQINTKQFFIMFLEVMQQLRMQIKSMQVQLGRK